MQEENQIVDQAERVMKTLSEARDDMGKKIGMVTTSQIRKFLTAVNTVTEKVNMYKLENEKTKDSLPIELQAQIKYLKVKLAYQIGRNNNRGKNPVKDFAEKA